MLCIEVEKPHQMSRIATLSVGSTAGTALGNVSVCTGSHMLTRFSGNDQSRASQECMGCCNKHEGASSARSREPVLTAFGPHLS